MIKVKMTIKKPGTSPNTAYLVRTFGAHANPTLYVLLECNGRHGVNLIRLNNESKYGLEGWASDMPKPLIKPRLELKTY
jgi:hypothetical protein